MILAARHGELCAEEGFNLDPENPGKEDLAEKAYWKLEDPNRFVWLRGFPDMERRVAGLTAFYGGPVWTAHRDAAKFLAGLLGSRGPRPIALEGLVLRRLAAVVAVALFGLASSVAFSRLSGRSAFAAMGFAIIAVGCLALVVFLVSGQSRSS